MDPFDTLSEVDRIAALGNPVIRNLQITQSYYELSSTISGRLGQCANWCTFATWASKQAGQTIRHEDLTRALEPVLMEAPEIKQVFADIEEAIRSKGARPGVNNIRQEVWDALGPKAAMERSGLAVAKGNQKVYAEIGREFARFVATCLNDSSFSAENIDRFCDGLRPGDPPDGQQYLRQAFRRYYQAIFEQDPKTKAELVFLANLEIGFHEQTRLQPEIAEALDASVVEPRAFARSMIGALFPNRTWVIYVVSMVMRLVGQRTALDTSIDRLIALLRQRIRVFLTDHLMTLSFPNGLKLRLGDDLRSGFPEVLKSLTNPELVALLKRIDPTPDSVVDTGAVDWADLPDRIHFIADLFRCFHEKQDLLMPPFLPDQVDAIKAEKLPAGKV